MFRHFTCRSCGFLLELATLHIDQLAAARLDTETAMLDLDKAHTAELDEVSRRHSDTMTQLMADLTQVTINLAAVTAGRDEDATEFTAQREQVGTVYYYYLYSFFLSLFANGRSQFLLDRLGRCLKLFVSTASPFSHEFASQFGLDIYILSKNIQNLTRHANVQLNELATRPNRTITAVTTLW